MEITTTTFLEKGLYKDKSNTKYSLMNVSILCYVLNKLTFLKELMLIRQVKQKSVIFVTFGIF